MYTIVLFNYESFICSNNFIYIDKESCRDDINNNGRVNGTYIISVIGGWQAGRQKSFECFRYRLSTFP